jgi:hypothetical protein
LLFRSFNRFGPTRVPGNPGFRGTETGTKKKNGATEYRHAVIQLG